MATGGKSADGTYMGAAVSFESQSITQHQRELNEGVRAASGDSINAVQIGFYDAVFALKAGMEKAQSVDAMVVAKALSGVSFESFFGRSAFGGSAIYGSPQQMLIPVIVTQLKDGKLVEVARIVSPEISFSHRLITRVATPFPMRFVMDRHSLINRSMPTKRAND